MRATLLAIGLVLCVTGVSCRQRDLRTMPIHVPGMKSQACVELVKAAVARVPGVLPDKTTVDPATRTVYVTYESLGLSLKNIEFAIADAGFAANEIPAKPEAAAALPPECK
jgi:copper chaperone CopZ